MVLNKKEFHERVDGLLDKYNLEEIKLLINNMAKNVNPEDRQNFLSKLKLKTENIHLEYEIISFVDELISDIRDGKYQEEWNNEDNYGDNEFPWGDECSLSPKSDLFEEIEYLFVESSKLFEAKEYEITFSAYEKLFELIDMGDDGDYPCLSESSSDKLELKEAILKYIQSGYYTSKPSDRPSAILDPLREHSNYISKETFLSDLDGVSTIPLPEFDEFLSDIIELSNSDVSEVPEDTYLEAIKLFKGEEGLKQLIEKKDRKNAKSYLVLLKELENREQYDEIIKIATSGIKSVSINDRDRAKIADYLTKIGESNSDIDLQQLGLISSIESDPRLHKLIDLYGVSGDNRPEIYIKILKRLKTINKKLNHATPYCTDRLLVQTAIFINEIPLIMEISNKRDPLGWSNYDAPSGIAIAVLLKLLSKRDKKVDLVDDLIKWELERHDYLDQKKSQLFIEIIESIQDTLNLTGEQIVEYRGWCENIIEERGHEILKNKYRHSYFKVAHLLSALRDMYYSNNLTAKGEALITKFQTAYPRHSAFRSELNKKLKNT